MAERKEYMLTVPWSWTWYPTTQVRKLMLRKAEEAELHGR